MSEPSVPEAADPAAGVPARDDDALLARFDGWERDQDAKWGPWRKKARESYAFVANDQWSTDERSAAETAGRLVTTLNRIGPMVNAVAGAEIAGRQQVQYIPRSIEDGGVNELLTKGAEWIRDRTGADRQESEAFRDTLICGLGYTETVMSYEEEPEGKVVIARIDPFEVTPDATAIQPNLIDGRYLKRRRKVGKSDFDALYPGASPDHYNSAGGSGRSGGNRRRAYKPTAAEAEEVCGEDEVMLTEWQWFDYETIYLAENPETHAVEVLTRQQRDQMDEAFTRLGAELRTVTQRRRRYWRTVVCGRQVLEHEPLPNGEFNIKVITGERDRNAGTWYGIVEPMKDPQKFANLFFSLLNHIIRTNAKGGILAEADAFEDQRQAEMTWAQPDAITWLAEGGLDKIKDKPSPQIPSVIGQLMEFSVRSIRDTSGINEEMLGMVGRDQAGVLEHQRKQAAYGIMAAFYDSLRSYRQLQGVLLLKTMRYLPDGYLVRITGEDGVARYAQLAKQPDTLKFDVIVDEAPTGPNQKERTWAMVTQMMPWLKDLGPDIWAELIKYSPFPEAVTQALVRKLQQLAQQGDQTDPLEQAERQSKVQRDQAGARKDMASAGRTEAETAAMLASIGSPALLPAA